MTKLKFTLLVLIAATTALYAQGTQWKADRAHSQVKFSVSHMVIAEVTGRFKEFTVTLEQPGQDFVGSKLEADIKTGSVDTDIESRDKHLRSDDFLNAEKYPDITFKSTSFEKTGNDTYKIAGNLTIRDVTKQVVLEAKYNGAVTDPMGNTKAGFKATTTINRFDYGVKWNKTIEAGGLVAGENVEITLLMELAKQK